MVRAGSRRPPAPSLAFLWRGVSGPQRPAVGSRWCRRADTLRRSNDLVIRARAVEAEVRNAEDAAQPDAGGVCDGFRLELGFGQRFRNPAPPDLLALVSTVATSIRHQSPQHSRPSLSDMTIVGSNTGRC